MVRYTPDEKQNAFHREVFCLDTIEKTARINRRVIRPCAALLALGLLLCGCSTEPTEPVTETLYRESAVERGDLTVGVSESAVATLQTHSLAFEVAAEISEIFVKAGQSVSAGDEIATITTESINDQIKTLRADYEEALLKLSEAQLAKQKGELDAKNTYNSTMNKADSADTTFDMAVQKLERAVEKAQESVEEIQTEIRTYTSLLRNMKSFEDDYEKYASLKAWYEDTESWYRGNENMLNQYISNKGGIANVVVTDPEYMRLLANRDHAEAEYYFAKLEYTNTAKDYSQKYDREFEDEDAIREARLDAQKRLVEAESAVKEAKYNLETQASQAGLTKDDNVARAGLADSIYEMELKSLDNNVSSKELSLRNIQEQIDKYNALLEKTTLYAPCDGIVVSVSAAVGDNVQSGYNVVTVSNSQNVFVYLSVTQDDITGIKLGQECSIEMDAFEAISFDGIVDSITTTPARSATGGASYNVTIKLEGDTTQIYEGMTGTATLITRQIKDVLYVSSRCVFAREGKSYVKVKRADDTIEEVQVTTGFSDGRNVEISEGLKEGDIVIIESQVTAQR